MYDEVKNEEAEDEVHSLAVPKKAAGVKIIFCQLLCSALK